jgi:hypothetical protein
MAAMRVSSLDLVLKTYADEKQLDVTKAVNSLPAPPAITPMLEAVGSPTAAGGVVPMLYQLQGRGGFWRALQGPRVHRAKNPPAPRNQKSPVIQQ